MSASITANFAPRRSRVALGRVAGMASAVKTRTTFSRGLIRALAAEPITAADALDLLTQGGSASRLSAPSSFPTWHMARAGRDDPAVGLARRGVAAAPLPPPLLAARRGPCAPVSARRRRSGDARSLWPRKTNKVSTRSIDAEVPKPAPAPEAVPTPPHPPPPGKARLVDVRDWKSWDREHLTRPARVCLNAPFSASHASDDALVDALVSACKRGGAVPSDGTVAIVCDADGASGAQEAAAAALIGRGWREETVRTLAGGWEADNGGWKRELTASGRRRPPAGRWVPTGNEALKSGLNCGDAAASYEEGGNAATARYNRKAMEGERGRSGTGA